MEKKSFGSRDSQIRHMQITFVWFSRNGDVPVITDFRNANEKDVIFLVNDWNKVDGVEIFWVVTLLILWGARGASFSAKLEDRSGVG